MKIQIRKSKDGTGLYIADCSDLPGSPPVGVGKTKDGAVKSLLRAIIIHHHIWLRHLDLTTYEEELVNE